MNATGRAPLTVRLSVDVTHDGVAKSDLVRVALINTSRFPVIVAGRLAIGYEDSSDREIYAVLHDRPTGEIVGGPAQLYHRAPHSADDLRTLDQGDQTSTEFNLDDWYTHPAGDLDLQVVYDPSAVAQRFPGVESAQVFSDPVRIVFTRAC
ncbi:MAG TPA: hypothetical protein VLL08_18925 [Kineosporiaceae bacterium]|nr:hypothetical protein [Kineosporiaceae bacterium]